jgi:hypothetical protein
VGGGRVVMAEVRLNLSGSWFAIPWYSFKNGRFRAKYIIFLSRRYINRMARLRYRASPI